MDEKKLRDELIRDEGIRLKAYKCSAGVWTIGVGHTGDITEDDVLCDETEAFALLELDINEAVRHLDEYWPKWRGLSDARQRALVNMVFNLGIGGVMKFKMMLAALAESRWDDAADAALDSKWADQVKGRAQRIATLIREG
jgi:lysozyme